MDMKYHSGTIGVISSKGVRLNIHQFEGNLGLTG
jgi:hypothetical protein